jgi:hypothetical protein
MQITSHKLKSSFKVALLIPGTFVALLFAILNLKEWYQVGWLATPSIIAQYPFGGESPAGDYWHYLNAHRYSRVALLSGLLMLGATFAFGFAIHRRSTDTTVAAYVALFLTFLLYCIITNLPVS